MKNNENTNREDIFYVNRFYNDVQRALKRNEEIRGTVYPKTGKHYNALLQTMPPNTLIRFWKNIDRSKNPISIATGRWKKNKKISKYEE